MQYVMGNTLEAPLPSVSPLEKGTICGLVRNASTKMRDIPSSEPYTNGPLVPVHTFREWMLW
ncbi:hypothetical protein BDV19DRAFT_353194 [Aspergillus venezuelensis]